MDGEGRRGYEIERRVQETNEKVDKVGGGAGTRKGKGGRGSVGTGKKEIGRRKKGW